MSTLIYILLLFAFLLVYSVVYRQLTKRREKHFEKTHKCNFQLPFVANYKYREQAILSINEEGIRYFSPNLELSPEVISWQDIKRIENEIRTDYSPNFDRKSNPSKVLSIYVNSTAKYKSYLAAQKERSPLEQTQLPLISIPVDKIDGKGSDLVYPLNHELKKQKKHHFHLFDHFHV